MSQVKKLKKTKKGMSPEAKANLGLTFKSIISNQACVDGGKDAPWWIAVIFLILSILLPLIPIMTKTNKLSGSSFLEGYNFKTDEGLYETTRNLVEDQKIRGVVVGNLLSFYEEDEIGHNELIEDGDPRLATLDEGGLVPVATVVTDFGPDQGSEYTFRMFITNLTGSAFELLVNRLAEDRFVQGSIKPRSIEDDITTLYYTPSFIAIGKDSACMALFGKHQLNPSASSPAGIDYTHTINGEDIFYSLLGSGESINEKIGTTLVKYQTFFKNGYVNAKSVLFRKTTLIYLGVYAGLVLFLGVMVFVLTRGKNNVFKFLSFFTCEKIAWWAAFTPGLLGMILAFILPGTSAIGQMAFVVLVSLRIMWLSMKQLKPVQ